MPRYGRPRVRRRGSRRRPRTTKAAAQQINWAGRKWQRVAQAMKGLEGPIESASEITRGMGSPLHREIGAVVVDFFTLRREIDRLARVMMHWRDE